MVIASVDRSPGLPWVGPCWLNVLGGLMSPRGGLLRVWLAVASSHEGSCVLMLEPSWCDDIMVTVSLFLDTVAALKEELVHPITVKAGSMGNAVRSARHGTRCAPRARFLGRTCLRMKADSSLKHDGWPVCHAGPSPGSGLGLVRHGAG